MIDDTGTRERDNLIRELRPLLFGTAWKVLDLLIEYGLNIPTPRAKWTIAAKKADAHTVAVAPLGGDHQIWSRIAAVYANTVEHRHCLIHRSFVFSAVGDMTHMHDLAQNPIADLTLVEQDAFCRLAQRSAMIVATQRYTQRERLDLVASLDALNNHHQMNLIGGGAKASQPLLIRIDATRAGISSWTIDIVQAMQKAAEVFPGRPYFDIEINFPDAGIPPLIGRLEDAPRDVVLELDLQHLPSWIEP